MKSFFLRNLRPINILANLLLIFGLALFCCACGPVAAFFGVAQAVILTIGAVLKSLATVLTPAEETAITNAVNEVSADLTIADNTITAYEADKTGAGLLDAVKAAVLAITNSLPQLIAAANIGNPTIKAWINAVAAAVGAAITAVTTLIIPALGPAVAARSAGDKTKMESLGVQLNAITAKLKADHAAALDASGLSAESKAAGNKFFNDKTAHHFLHIKV